MNCNCQDKLRTEVDGRFVYQVCDTCGEIYNVVYLGPKQTEDDWDEALIGVQYGFLDKIYIWSSWNTFYGGSLHLL